ncbi:MAG: hypothetical protein MUE85_11020 [Microscillaceae bacterium]|jgi:hypothetical protein|nr:hypothetical protein [Microscillaceae bacterium]
MLHKFFARYCPFLLIFLLACDLKDAKEVDSSLSFTKIFDNDLFAKTFTPLDVKQTPDGGYLVLGETAVDFSTFAGIFLLKIDRAGNAVFSQTLADGSLNPVSDLVPTANGFFLMCMDILGNETKLIRIDFDGIRVTEVQRYTGINNPLSATPEGNSSWVVQHYNQDENAVYVSSLANNNPSRSQQMAFPIVVDGYTESRIEDAIFKHLNRIGRKKPFMSGSLGSGMYFYNGYLEETFSVVFFRFGEEYAYGPDGGQEPAKLLGVSDDEVVSNIFQTGNRTFALARYANGANFFTTKTDDLFNDIILNNTVIQTEDLTNLPILELFPNARVVLKRVQIGGRRVLLYASDTIGKQIVLFAYDEATGNLLGKKYLGSGFPYEIGGFDQTDDGGLAVVGTTYITGRFPRVCMFKLSNQDLLNLISLSGN